MKEFYSSREGLVTPDLGEKSLSHQTKWDDCPGEMQCVCIMHAPSSYNSLLPFGIVVKDIIPEEVRFNFEFNWFCIWDEGKVGWLCFCSYNTLTRPTKGWVVGICSICWTWIIWILNIVLNSKTKQASELSPRPDTVYPPIDTLSTDILYMVV